MRFENPWGIRQDFFCFLRGEHFCDAFVPEKCVLLYVHNPCSGNVALFRWQLGHILKLSKNNVAAIYIATKRFSNFRSIDFSATPEVN
jgi:hypothetical protein